MREGLLDRNNDLAWIVVGEEKHEDGGIHFHVAMQTGKNVRSRDAKYFDWVSPEKSGNYQKMKGSTRDAVKYCIKEGNWLSDGIDVAAVLAKKNAQAGARAMRMIEEGRSLKDIRDSVPAFAMGNKRKIEEWIGWEQCQKRRLMISHWFPFDSVKVESLEGSNKVIAQWLDHNLFKEREFKQKQLFIYGDANMGKTYLVNSLKNYCNTYVLPNEEFYNLYEDGLYDLCVLDEFKANKTVQFLNEWLQGSTMSIRKKGSQGEKNDNIPTIMLSNYSLEECYMNTSDAKLDTLRCRLEIVHVTERLDIDLEDLFDKRVEVIPVEDDEYEDVSTLGNEVREDMGEEWRQRMVEEGQLSPVSEF